MSLFCLALPLMFFLFWKSLADENSVSTGGVWAVILGAVFAFIQYMTGPFISSGEFGFIQWLIAFLDVVFIPVLTGLGVCVLLMVFHAFSSQINVTNFLLLWCIPYGIFWTLGNSSQAEPLYLVIVPIIWIALAVGFGFFINKIMGEKTLIVVLCIIGAVLLPLTGATAYWALYCQEYLLGYSLFGVTLIPMLFCTGSLFYEALGSS